MRKTNQMIRWLTGMLCVCLCFCLCGCAGENRIVLKAQEAADGNAKGKLTGSYEAENSTDGTQESILQDAAADGSFAQEAGGVQKSASEQEQLRQMPEEAEQSSQPQTCYVYVCGAVALPGVYEVLAGTHLCDVIGYAGGMTEDGEETSFNQAATVSDGMMLIVPTKEEWADGAFVTGQDGLPVRAVSGAASGQGDAGSGALSQDGLLSINEASAEQLSSLPGVGKVKAESIVAYRQEHGAFESIEEIKNVPGIKDGLFEKIKTKIKV
ncbi:MAG: helix-hairpin-helix domain-containing protein [Lachnospiraceae bacterium]|nr:helix-hairpin-helix domain-containing protein [Lachnospiraceae bacterium]